MARENIMTLFSDIQNLQNNANGDTRARIAGDVSQFFSAGIFEGNEKQIASEIIRLLVCDVEISIRKILAENLKHTNWLPHDVAILLANDIADIAIPVLQYSDVLKDDDLLRIIESREELECLLAIAERPRLSKTVSSALIYKEQEPVTRAVICNEGADISQESLSHILAQYAGSESLMSALIQHHNVTPAFAERIIATCSNAFSTILKEAYQGKHSERTSDKILAEAKESLIVKEYGNKQTPEQVLEMINHLHRTGKLTNSVIIKALCKGNIPFFMYGISKLAAIPRANVERIIREGGSEGMYALFQKAHIPMSTYEATRVFLILALGITKDGLLSEAEFAKQMKQALIERQYDEQIAVIRYFINLMEQPT